jgi:hypothetical protein
MRLVSQFARLSAKRLPQFVTARYKVHVSPITRRYNIHSRYIFHFASLRRSISSNSQNMEESLRNLDINAAEQFSRDWFGDHANWSHETLSALLYGRLAIRLLSIRAHPCSRGSLSPAASSRLWRLCVRWSSTWWWSAIVSPADKRRMDISRQTIQRMGSSFLQHVQ